MVPPHLQPGDFSAVVRRLTERCGLRQSMGSLSWGNFSRPLPGRGGCVDSCNSLALSGMEGSWHRGSNLRAKAYPPRLNAARATILASGWSLMIAFCEQCTMHREPKKHLALQWVLTSHAKNSDARREGRTFVRWERKKVETTN